MRFKVFYNLIVSVLLTGCAGYKSSVMFQNYMTNQVDEWLKFKDFTVEAHDILEITVAPLGGEELLIPAEEELNRLMTIQVDADGIVNIPSIQRINLMDLTLRQTDSILRIQFAKIMTDPFIKTRFLNKRVSVIGAMKTGIVELPSPGIRLTEVIALSGGLPPDSHTDNIRILRGNSGFIAKLTDINERHLNDIYILPGDVIYIEPVKRPFKEGIRDALPVISTFTSLITVIALIATFL